MIFFQHCFGRCLGVPMETENSDGEFIEVAVPDNSITRQQGKNRCIFETSSTSSFAASRSVKNVKRERFNFPLCIVIFLAAVMMNTAILYTMSFDLISTTQLILLCINDPNEPFDTITAILILQCLVAPIYIAVNRITEEKIRNAMKAKSDCSVDSATVTDTETETDTASVSSDDSLSTEATPLSLNEMGVFHHNGDVDEDIETAFANLPKNTSSWKYGSLFIQPSNGTKCPGIDATESVPIGVPVDFESDLFKGKILFRFRNGKTDDENSHSTYFSSSQFKVQRQVMIQGQFKRKFNMSEIYMGDIFDKQWNLSPPPRIGRMVNKIFTRLVPGLIIDVVGEKPKVLALIGAGSHMMSIDKPGNEPDITAPDIPENTFLSNDLKSSEARKVVLGNPNEASQFEFDPNLVYTFHTIDEVLDFVTYQLRLPFMTIDIDKALGDQPMSIRAVTQPIDRPCESLFYFRCWHERTVTKLKEANLQG